MGDSVSDIKVISLDLSQEVRPSIYYTWQLYAFVYLATLQ